MKELARYCAPLAWTGQTRSEYSRVTQYIPSHPTRHSRTKEKLRSGELAVAGDQWPIFLYHGEQYDPDDPWNGLFRSALLLSVSNYFALIRGY
jgi:hypothetical protein